MPLAVVALVMTGAVPDVIVRVKAVVPVPLAFDALKVTLKVPATVGVPEMTPVEVLTESPAGNPVAL